MKRRKQQESYKHYVQRFADWLRWHFFLGEYKLYVEFETGPIKNHPDAIAVMTTDDVYLTLILQCSPALREDFDQKKFWTVANVLVHEFSHGVTHPIWKLHDPTRSKIKDDGDWDIYERQTQRVANIVMKNIKKSEWMPR